MSLATPQKSLQIHRPDPQQLIFSLAFRRNPSFQGFQNLFMELLPLLQIYQPQLIKKRQPLICWAGSHNFFWSYLGFSLHTNRLIGPIIRKATTIPDYISAGDKYFGTPISGELFATDPLVFHPWSLWTATTAYGLAGPYWLPPPDLPHRSFQWSTPSSRALAPHEAQLSPQP